MKAALEDAASNSAIVRYMQRKDQTPASRADVLQSVRVAKSHNREVGKAVASCADDSNEHTGVQAIQTLEAMGKSVLIDNQQFLSGIASDSRRNPSLRAAASKALAAIP